MKLLRLMVLPGMIVSLLLAVSCRQPQAAGDATASAALAEVAETRKAPPVESPRRQAAARTRRIIFNNDGNEPVMFCRTTDPSELLSLRTTGLAGSQVDAIFYCTWSSGFSLFTHDTKAGQLFDTRQAMFSNNVTRAMVRQGQDPLRLMVDFCHGHGRELFWSFRVNDTHDGASAPYGPVMFAANQLKREHPQFLLGTKTNRPQCGVWTAVNYGLPEIRELAFRYVEEVCRNYDVDGIELDFFRHPVFFPSTAAGRECTEEERGLMTAWLRRIRQMAESRGARRARPILIAVRVPDSVAYCRAIGLDAERWLAGDLVDLVVGSGYFQLNSWEYTVELARRHGVRAYASLDEIRIRNKEAARLRSSLAAYRGRALNAWNARADGVYLFNFFNPASPLWRELGDPQLLIALDRDYFASFRGAGPKVSLPHGPFMRLPTLNPDSPLKLAPGKSARTEINVGEDLSASFRRHPGFRATLRLQFDNPEATAPRVVSLNGARLDKGSRRESWLEFGLDPRQVRRGTNTVEVFSHATKGLRWNDLMLAIRKQPNPAP